MNILDISIIIIVGFCVIHSFFRGLIRGIFALLALIVGIIVANNYYIAGASFLVKKWLLSPDYAKILIYAIIFAVFGIGIIIIGRLAEKLIGKLKLNWLNRAGGSIFGLLKGLLTVYIIVLFLTLLLPAKSPLLRESRYTPLILSAAKSVSTLVPSGYIETLKEKEKMIKKWKGSFPTVNQNE